MTYTDDFLRQCPLLKDLNKIALSYAWAYVEGNLVYDHPFHSINDPFSENFFEKRYNLFQLAQNKRHIMEIGFNAGHSTLIMLLANPAASYVLFDLNYHKYTNPCFCFLKQTYPDMSINYGDSKITIPEFALNQGTKPDLIHVDGGHDIEHATLDFENCKKLSTKDTTIIFDDTIPENHLDELLEEKIKRNLIKPVDRNALGLNSNLSQTIFNYIFEGDLDELQCR
jgi:hypothetical protein